MRYLVVKGGNQFELINNRESKVTIYYNAQPIAEGIGNIEFELKSIIVNPIVELHFEDGLNEYAGVQYMDNIGIVNFRDIGGYLNDEGKQIKFREFYRGAVVLSKGEEMERLTTLNIKTVLDLRSQWEVNNDPDVELGKTEYVHCSAMKSMDELANGSKSLNINDLEKEFEDKEPIEMMKILYKDLIFNNEAYKKMFEILESNQTPILFHCSAGKDRTGIAAAFIMLALGVDRKQVIEEYLLTNIYRKSLIEEFAKEKGISFEEAQMVQGVKEEYIQMIFDMISEKYPNIDVYLETEFGLNKERRDHLKELYTI